MGVTGKIRRALRGDVRPGAALLEAGRRGLVALRVRRERAAALAARPGGEAPPLPHARLAPEFARVGGARLLEHFRARSSPRLFAGFAEAETDAGRAYLATKAGRFDPEASASGGRVDWLREPASGARWPLDFHADVRLVRGDGSDVRVLWELNRLGHLLALGRAYAARGDESLAEEFFAQVEGWAGQNPLGFGPNWACAMEVALRATNLLAAFQMFRRSRSLDGARLASLLALFDAHGRHVRRNLEYSYIAAGNHYLSDVVGLLWLGVCLPELEAAAGWREFALTELLRELDRQVLPDGADWESSTGYHRFVTELFLYSFLLCKENGVEIDEGRWRRLRSMLEYARAYLRPDGRAPLVGDSDGGQFLPLVRRGADDHAYLLAVGAALFREPRFKVLEEPPEEVFWLLGAEGMRAYGGLETAAVSSSVSEAFAHAGVCVLREGDLYLMLNASGAGLGGRGAHGHNDALSIEVSACGVSFIKDPGTYVYTSDLRERHLFRSTAYHSTVEVDGAEQNTTHEGAPFHIGDEARPRLLSFASGGARDAAVAEHQGYERLPAGPVTHRRSVTFERRGRLWLVEDVLEGAGAHDFRFVFHAAPGLAARVFDGRAQGLPECSAAEISDGATGARLFVVSLDVTKGLAVEPRRSSREYGSKEESAAAVWALASRAPLRARWLLVPVCAGEDAAARLELAGRLKDERDASVR